MSLKSDLYKVEQLQRQYFEMPSKAFVRFHFAQLKVLSQKCHFQPLKSK